MFNPVDLVMSSFAGMHISAEEATVRLEIIQTNTLSGDWTTEDLLRLHQAQEILDVALAANDFPEDDDFPETHDLLFA